MDSYNSTTKVKPNKLRKREHGSVETRDKVQIIRTFLCHGVFSMTYSTISRHELSDGTLHHPAFRNTSEKANKDMPDQCITSQTK